MPKVSVVMSVYKEHVDLLRACVESILHQTYRDFEFIVVVDWPDNKEAIQYLTSCANSDPRLRFTINEKNIGQGSSRNYAVSKATGEFIALQDADDLSVPERFQKQVDFLTSNPDADVVGTGLIYKDLNTGKVLYQRQHNLIVGKEINKQMPCGHPSVMVRKRVFDKFGNYDTKFVPYRGEQTFVEDYDLFLRWHIQGVTFRNLQDYLYIYLRDGTKVPKAKSMLISVVGIKKKYLSKLNYTFSDYMYLYAQQTLSYFPSKFIVYIFYKFFAS